MSREKRFFPLGTDRRSSEPPTSFLRDLDSATVGETVIPFLHVQLLTKRLSVFSVIQDLPVILPSRKGYDLDRHFLVVSIMKHVFKDHAR